MIVSHNQLTLIHLTPLLLLLAIVQRRQPSVIKHSSIYQLLTSVAVIELSLPPSLMTIQLQKDFNDLNYHN